MNSKKISIYGLSKLTEIPWSTIANYKKGADMLFTNACKIADVLGVSLDELRDDF
ncbi:helix-turn-helix transcriptional regulator [Lactobacillus melliventris]|uniref:helix-turn-helix domain-containing protein n=1 Tax=Lactobacillus melliventris TaxID=1218507 RepID=UPI0021AC6F6A|nr:helix-turn-helix transcriptional regulator [Lactobacillus melliventris]